MAIVRNQRLHFDSLTNAIDTNGFLDTCKIHLFKDDLVPVSTDEHSDYTLPEATGLLSQDVTWSAIFDDDTGGYQVVSGLHTFQRGNDSDDPETFYGYLLYRQVGYDEYLMFAERFETPVTLATTLDAIHITLRYGEGLTSEVSASVIS